MSEKFSIQPYLNDIEILNQTVEQIKKDFSFFDLPIIFTGNKETAFNELLSQIYPHIKKLMESAPDKKILVILGAGHAPPIVTVNVLEGTMTWWSGKECTMIGSGY